MRGPMILGALALLAACKAGPDYARPEMAATQAFVRGGTLDRGAPATAWWEGMGDPQLAGLVEEGLAAAPGLAAAEARLRQARSGVAASRAALLPALSGSATYVHADLPGNAFGGGSSGFYSLGFDAQWEADLWGGRRREVEQRIAGAGVAAAQLADVKVALSAEITRYYVTLQARLASIALVAQRADLEAQLARYAEQRLAAGTGTRQQLALLRQRVARTGAELAALGAEADALRDVLATLAGQPPGSRDGIARAAIPLPPAEVAIGDPAAMLARRPDVMAAERKLASATAAIGVAEARRFPQVSLLGLIGLGGTTIDGMSNGLELSTAALPRLTWNFLDFGRTGAAIDGANAARDAAQAEYDAAVLSALGDAEASLARFGAARTRFREAGAVAREGEVAARLEATRADAGTIARAAAIEAEISMIDASLAEANERAALAIAYVALAKSLGLGWEAGDSLSH